MEQTVPDEVEARLRDARLPAYLSTCADGRPHVAPLWYRYEDGTVELLTTGQKLANVRRNPRVSLSIEADDEGIPDWRVTILGTATVIEDEDERREANRKLNQKYGVDDDSWEENDLVRVDVGSISYETW